MITGMIDPAIFGYQSPLQMDMGHEMPMEHHDHNK
jgi:hypothetical protein